MGTVKTLSKVAKFWEGAKMAPSYDWHGNLGDEFKRAFEEVNREMEFEKIKEAIARGAVLVVGAKAFEALKMTCETHGIEIRLCRWLDPVEIYVVSRKFFEVFLSR